jgi:hypothetical protein
MKTPDGGSIDMAILMKNADQADCEEQSRKLEKGLADNVVGYCVDCTTPTSKCMTDLAPRFATMFDNKPSSLTYISLARGIQAEREMRVIYWGVTVDQSDALCSLLPEFRKQRKGEVTCVRARRG